MLYKLDIHFIYLFIIIIFPVSNIKWALKKNEIDLKLISVLLW